MNWFIYLACFLCMLLTSCATTTSTKDSSKLIGRVEHKNGEAAPNVQVKLLEEPNRTFSVVPIALKEVSKVTTNNKGEFEFDIPTGINTKKLILTVDVPPKEKQIAPGKVEVTSADVSIPSPPSLDSPNIIVVPDDFKPDSLK